ncbi:hypothetical protein, variant [Thecamonas trahens ATCC 50062]|nr:hypothetical protein, variant [Thecamonas trahens ATCC 50062]KNC50787.1 hypothetical protein, variant [Thecamonas trahens ATCC 50062]|eukprot:XP_013756745.1 hypothetical protein, variant [Thecamonas trahens ATCC 50062]
MQYRHWKAGVTDAAELNRCLRLLRSHHTLKSFNSSFSNMLLQSREAVRHHLASRSQADGETASASGHQGILHTLHSLAAAHSLSVMVDDSMSDAVTIALYANTLMLDVNVTASGAVASAALTLVANDDMISDDETNAKLTALATAADWSTLSAVLGHFCDLHVRLPDEIGSDAAVAVSAAFAALTADVRALSAASVAAAGLYATITSGIGSVSLTASGLLCTVWAAASAKFALADETTSPSLRASLAELPPLEVLRAASPLAAHGMIHARLSYEVASQPSRLLLGSALVDSAVAGLAGSNGGPGALNVAKFLVPGSPPDAKLSAPIEASFVLELYPPLVTSCAWAAEAAAVAFPPPATSKVAMAFSALGTGDASPLAAMLVGHDALAGPQPVTVLDTTHAYAYAGEPGVRGVLVHRIPFLSLAHLATVLDLLRQHAVFNTLLASCFSDAVDAASLHTRPPPDTLRRFELTTLAPQLLTVSYLAPGSGVLTTIEISCGCGGSLAAAIIPAPGASPVDSPAFAALLATSHSIPLAMHYHLS